ncbi:MAG: ABC transporter ATP-binding protein [Nonomuraea sp.]|nr:ABC transporter ATP-binding protein [Nonomuraea sp.]
MADRLIEVRDLCMRYGERDVLRDVGFAMDAGEVVVLLGPNGAGKTTTIEILEGFRARSAGQVSVLGADPGRAGERWRSRIGVVLQSWRDHGSWRVRELLEHLGGYYRPFGTPYPIGELVAAVGLEELAGQRVSRLSGGQRRRLDVAIGIVGRPELLFLDEPTAGLDPHARRDFHDLVHRLSDLDDTGILLTTHDLDEAEKLADRIIILVEGAVVADGSPDELARRVTRDAQVRWSLNGEQYVHATTDATGYVRDLFVQYGDAVEDLEVRRATLEDTYMAMVGGRRR